MKMSALEPVSAQSLFPGCADLLSIQPENLFWTGMEVRTKLPSRIARVLFLIEGSTMILLHGFIKKQQKTPQPELNLAKDRLKQFRREQ